MSMNSSEPQAKDVADGSPPPPSLDIQPAEGFGQRTGSYAPAPDFNRRRPLPPSGSLTESPREFVGLRFIIPPVSLPTVPAAHPPWWALKLQARYELLRILQL